MQLHFYCKVEEIGYLQVSILLECNVDVSTNFQSRRDPFSSFCLAKACQI